MNWISTCICGKRNFTTKVSLSSANWKKLGNNRFQQRWKCDKCYSLVIASKVG